VGDIDVVGQRDVLDLNAALLAPLLACLVAEGDPVQSKRIHFTLPPRLHLCLR
jgi:hypothetical protein